MKQNLSGISAGAEILGRGGKKFKLAKFDNIIMI
jgi:hypothetical protein